MRYSKDFTFTNFVETNNLEKIKIALGRELELREFIDRKGNSLVSVAIEKGDLKLLEFLISKEADLNVVNADGKTPLMIAASKRSEEILRMLLENGAEIDKRNDRNSDRYKWTALMYAVNIGYSKGVKILIENGADVNKKDNDGWTALMLAASSNDKEMVKHLVAHPKIEINNQDLKGKTALIYAAENNEIEVIKLLLEKGAEVNISDKTGRTALIYTVRIGSSEIAELLINNGADINKVDSYKLTALFYAVSDDYLDSKKQQQSNIILLLIEKGADPHAKNEHGASAFELGNLKIKKLLQDNDDFESPEVQELSEVECSTESWGIKQARETISKFFSASKNELSEVELDNDYEKSPMTKKRSSRSSDEEFFSGSPTGRAVTWAGRVAYKSEEGRGF